MTGESLLADPASADAVDALADRRARFVIPDEHLCYLDGNSLGRPPRSARPAADAVLEAWSHRLVESWDEWIDRPIELGDALAPVLGASPGQVTIGESTTVALYMAVDAALTARPDRDVIVALVDDFPTDRYVVDGLAAARTRVVRRVSAASVDDLVPALGTDVAVVVASAVHFETAAVADLGQITAAAHEVGALVVWDCSHAAGAVPLDLDANDVDLAVGCTYKYLHAGPGAPSFTYVAHHCQDRLRQPIHGWFGQRDQFSMGPVYDPMPGIGAWRVGTPGMLGLEVAAAGIAEVADAGIAAIRTKSLALGSMLLAAHDRWFTDLGLTLGSPRLDAHRGGHVALHHPDASRIVRAARAVGVIADFRAPDIVRLGPGPLTTSFAELASGLDRLRDVIETKAYEHLPESRGRVT